MTVLGTHRRRSVLVDALESGVTVVSLIGEHDVATVDEVRDTLCDLLHEGADVVVDLSETVFVECRIMHALKDSVRLASHEGARICFQSARSPIVKRVFELLGNLGAWPVYESRAGLGREPQLVSGLMTTAARPRMDLREASDADLLEGIVHGDPDCFLRLFERYAPTAVALAQRILHQRHLAEDAAQEAFLAVWRQPDRYRAELGTVRSWLMSVVHHRAVDLVRREESNRKRVEDLPTLSYLDRPAADPCDLVVHGIGLVADREAARRALEYLRPEQREIIELMYFRGLSQTQISGRLSLPLGTVKSRTLLAMRHLRAALSGWKDDRS